MTSIADPATVTVAGRSDAAPAIETPNLRGHMPALDGLRGMAALLVIWTHVGTTFEGPWQHSLDLLAYKFAASMWLGVDLFFVLSGFLITGILLDSRGSTTYFRAFYARRALRIFPLYYGFLALVFIVLPRLGVVIPDATARADHLWYWTYLTNVRYGLDDAMSRPMGYLWSLAVEEQFYLVWPLVVLLLPTKRLIQLCAAIVGAVFLGRIALAAQGMGWVQAYVLTPTRMDALALGAMIAGVARTPAGLGRLRRRAPAVLAATGAAILLLMVYKPILALLLGLPVDAVNRSTLPHDLEVQMLRFTANALFFGALLVLTLTSPRRGVLGRFFGSRTMRFFGRYSYAIYIFHVPLYILAERYGLAGEFLPRVHGWQIPRVLLFYALLTASATLLAMLSWHAYEKHFLKLKTRFEYRRRAHETPAAHLEAEREAFATP